MQAIVGYACGYCEIGTTTVRHARLGRMDTALTMRRLPSTQRRGLIPFWDSHGSV